MTVNGGRSVSVCVNGKWLAQPASGTQRYATGVMRAVSATPIAPHVTLIVPRDATEPPWAGRFRIVRSRLRGQLFEQLALPWLSRGAHLYSLAGPAPLLKRKQTVVMHDAMPFRCPGTFRLAFIVWYRFMYTVLSRTATRLFTVSSFSRTELSSVLGVPERRFELAPCGADHVDARPLADAGTPLPFAPGSYALIVGNLAPHKNVIAAAGALSGGGVPVVVVGGAQQVFRDVAPDRPSAVCFLGRIDDRQLRRLYGTAGVLVAASSYEGFGLPIVEAGRLGCPAVYATGSALTEVAGESGCGFPPGDWDRCVEVVRRILSSTDLRHELAARARSNAARFTWAGAADKIFAGAKPAHDDGRRVPLRVLHVTETFSAGTGSAIIGYARAVRDHGVESMLLAQDRGSGLLTELGGSSPFTAARIVGPGLANLWRAIGSAVKEDNPDIVHLHSSMAGGVGRLRLALGHTPIVYSPHCFAFERRDVSPMRRWAFHGVEFLLARRTGAFVCVSPHEAGLARRLASRADVVHLLNSFSPAPATSAFGSMPGADAAAMRIVTVGRVAPQKDPGLFVRIVTMLADAGDVHATWVGDGAGNARDALESAGVSVTGWLPVEQVPAAMASQTVYLHTAGWEAALPIAAIDAMQAGLPVVMRRNAAYHSMLPDDWQFDDAPSAAEMIRALARRPARQRRIREQFELLVELRKDNPALVLPPEYRRLFQKSKAGPRAGTSHSDGGTLPTGHDSTIMKESWWRNRYTAS
ncbi:glycosyltransferase [Mycobacterium sp. Marseille-P9652]|uniref:glycosyltransferase n=1 Tax=Mycobacterium sp. Marseille-P9652 TaxID=2654950 RepID=UPI0018D15831|nr:glycosyltransferase [Mycobacterium sp. Marseille-P9652]